MIKYSIHNTLSAVATFIQAIISFIWQLSNPILYPWISAYVSSIYSEIVTIYFAKCKEMGLPYVEPSPVTLAMIASQIKQTSQKETVFTNIKNKHSMFYIKLILAPFSISGRNKEDITVVHEAATEHNKRFLEEYAKIEIIPLTKRSVKLLDDTFTVE